MISSRTRWLAMALLWSAAAAQVVPSNTSSEQPSGTFQMMATSQMSTIADILALTDVAENKIMPPPGLTGTLFLTTTETISNLTTGNIAFISCDAADYPGNIDAVGLLERAVGMNATASLLYSISANYCKFENPSTSIQQSIVYSMTNASDSSKIVDDLTPPLPPSQVYMVTIVHNGTSGGNDGNSTNNSNNSNPLGPSPSTAVAMIILYSITGIITALFLIIIITGAIRAHRNPERYGPRDMMGRPRQSRARGLARAMLDTLPIVKFGEREAPKPTDVEMAPTTETRDTGDVANAHDDLSSSTSQKQSAAPSAVETTQPHETAEQNGISAAEPLPVVAAGSHQGLSTDEGLGCSICTDDFERGQDIRVLPCNHKFHPACVDPWLLNVSGTCPLCRIDLRPTTSDSASNRGSQDGTPAPDLLAPPLDPEAENANSHSHRRRSALREMLSLHSRPNATTEERLAALRRLRDERRQAEDAAASSSSTPNADDGADAGRRRRMSARLQEVFSVKTRRGADAVPEREATGGSGSAGSEREEGEAQNGSEGRNTSR